MERADAKEVVNIQKMLAAFHMLQETVGVSSDTKRGADMFASGYAARRATS